MNPAGTCGKAESHDGIALEQASHKYRAQTGKQFGQAPQSILGQYLGTWVSWCSADLWHPSRPLVFLVVLVVLVVVVILVLVVVLVVVVLVVVVVMSVAVLYNTFW